LAENLDGDYCSLHDANYNVAAITYNNGAIAERYLYDPYGGVGVRTWNWGADSDNISDIGQSHLFTGRELDLETYLQLNRHRFYTSHLGRWLTRDPIDYEAEESNLYNYGYNAPIHLESSSVLGHTDRFTTRDPFGELVRIGEGLQSDFGAYVRFTPIDLVGSLEYQDGMNLYEYTKSRGVNGLDPSGLQWTQVPGYPYPGYPGMPIDPADLPPSGPPYPIGPPRPGSPVIELCFVATIFGFVTPWPGDETAAVAGVSATWSTAQRTAFLRTFFAGQNVAKSEQAIQSLKWYQTVAQETLANYKTIGYRGTGVAATQQERLRQIGEKLAEWGVK
jgi:RHS repeat-associated protein